jgi:hypothetical protein
VEPELRAFVGMRSACKMLAGKPEGKRSLGRRRHRWKVHIRIDLRKKRVGKYGLCVSGLGQPQMADCREHDNKPSVSIKGGNILTVERLLTSQEGL